MPRPKSFRSSFTCVYLVPENLYKPLMKTLNNIQLHDVDTLNTDASEGKFSSISEGSSSIPNLPPVIKLNKDKENNKDEIVNNSNEDEIVNNSNEDEIVNNSNDEAMNAGFSPESEMNTQDHSTTSNPVFSNNIGTGTDPVLMNEMSTGTDPIGNMEKDTQTFEVGKDAKETQTAEVSTKDFSTQVEPAKQDMETQTDRLSLKKCDKCHGLFQGLNSLLQHKKLFHKGRRAVRPLIFSTSTKRKHDEMDEPEKKREKGDITDPEEKKIPKVQFVKDNKATSIFDLTDTKKKGRKKEDLQSGSGTKRLITNNGIITDANNKLTFTHWL